MTHSLIADGIMLEQGRGKILSDIYLHCETGKITGLLGKNGSGKSSLLKIIYGCLKPSVKSIRFDTKMITTQLVYPHLIRYLPQHNFIPGSLSLRRVFRDFHVGIDEFGNNFPEFRNKFSFCMNDLSGGEIRLIELYIILRSKSQFVMLDEPFTHMMPLYFEKITAIMTEEKRHKGILITDQIYSLVVGSSDHVYVLSNGKTYRIPD